MSLTAPRVLMVGAGAVGQVYAWALQNAGVKVDFYVKPRHAASVRAGMPLWRRRFGRKPEPSTLYADGVYESDLPAPHWDEVWLAVSSTAVTDTLLDQLLAQVGDAVFVVFPTHPDGLAHLRARLGERMVGGLISFIAWQAPLPGETDLPAVGTRSDGIAFYVPPAPAPFWGPAAARDRVIQRLRQGGLPCQAVPDLERTIAWGGALLQLHIAALDAADWNFPALRRSDLLSVASDAWKELVPIAAAGPGGSPPPWTGWIRPPIQRLVAWLAPRIMPFDLATYLGYHFTKVGDQTRANLELWIARGRAAGLPVGAIERLRARMREVARFDGSPLPP